MIYHNWKKRLTLAIVRAVVLFSVIIPLIFFILHEKKSIRFYVLCALIMVSINFFFDLDWRSICNKSLEKKGKT